MRSYRRAFTLVELLVVIAVIGVLVGVLLPAINAAREAAFRNGCRNNLRQIALAMVNYEVSTGKFPIGLQTVERRVGADDRLIPNLSGSGVTAFYSILPMLEENAVHSTFDKTVDIWDPANAQLIAKPIEVYTCPSDDALGRIAQVGSGSELLTLARSNYVLNFGTATLAPDLNTFETNGPFKAGGSRRVSDLVDGTSKTVLVSEVLSGKVDLGSGDARGAWAGPYGGSAVYTHFLSPNDGQGDYIPSSVCTESALTMPCDSSAPSNLDQNLVYTHYAAARSAHRGGVQVVFADAHVIYVPNEVNYTVWQALSTIEGNETVDASDL